MEALKDIIKLGFSIRLDSREKIWFKYKGGKPRPDKWQVKQLVREIQQNREIAVKEIKKIESAEMLNDLLLPTVCRIKIDYVGDNIDN